MDNKISTYSPAFSIVSWVALIGGIVTYLLGLWNAEMQLNEKGYYFAVLVLGLFSAASYQKTVRDKYEGIPTTSIYYMTCLTVFIISVALLLVGLWNATLLKKEKGTYLPTVGAFGGVTYSSLFDARATTPVITGVNQALYLGLNELTISNNWMVGAAVKWEIFTGFERQHKIHEAKININQLQNQIDDTKEKLALLLENNWVNYTVLNKKLEIAYQQEKISKNNLNLASKQYTQGLISVSERLEAENDCFKSAVNKINTLIDQRLAAIETIIATGDLTKQLKKQ